MRDDAEDDAWLFDRAFDFVHLRLMCTCFNDSKAVLGRIYEHLQPGGWVEWHDYAGEMLGADEAAEAYLRGSPVYRWWNLLREGLLKATGRDVRVSKQYKTYMYVRARSVEGPYSLFLCLYYPPSSKKQEVSLFSLVGIF